ncbi:MAG: hypothetical protein DDG60_13880 [Anaerolineae bacterium]|nr:MAG: hypothetical protein DDG60_13880 [Anaerolineae bacterium]
MLLILLALVSLVMPFLSGQRPTGNVPQNRPENVSPPAGNGNFQPGSGGFPQRPGGVGMFGPVSLLRSLGLGGMYINLGMAVIGVGLSALAAFWVWKKKKAGLNLALLLAITFLLGALPGVFSGLRTMDAATILRYALNLLSAGASLVVLAMSSLPSVRDEVE